MMNEQTFDALRNWMRDALGAEVAILAAKPLEGGSIQENWRISCRIDGQSNDFVLRKNAPAKIGSSRSRHEEFTLLQTAHQAGVRVPRPVAVCRDPAVIGVPFFLMQWVDGVGLGSRTALREAAIVAVAISKPAFLSLTERDAVGVSIGGKPAVLGRLT
jgi:aminoglycoside phosphotransferase (APT) family kinase protein